jgi:hypothetical protein
MEITTMNNQHQTNLILQAIEMASNWDLDDEYLADAIQSQAELLAGTELDSFDTSHDFH